MTWNDGRPISWPRSMRRVSLSSAPEPKLAPAKAPRPLRAGALRERLLRGRLLLCLDYDGTLSEIVANPMEAWPVPGAREAILSLAKYPANVVSAVVSGR